MCKLRKKESYFDKLNQKWMLHEKIICMKSFSKFDLDCFVKEKPGYMWIWLSQWVVTEVDEGNAKSSLE